MGGGGSISGGGGSSGSGSSACSGAVLPAASAALLALVVTLVLEGVLVVVQLDVIGQRDFHSLIEGATRQTHSNVDSHFGLCAVTTHSPPFRRVK